MIIIKYEEPLKSKVLTGKDILVGILNNGDLVYVSAEGPTRHAVLFPGNKTDKINFLTTNIMNSILGGKSILVVSNDVDVTGFAKENDYIVKEFDLEKDSNRFDLLSVLKDKNPEYEVNKFISKLIDHAPDRHQLNAINYLSSVIMHVRYFGSNNIKDLRKYLMDFEGFKKVISEKDNPASDLFKFSLQANNFLKWDITSISDVIKPLLSNNVIKKLSKPSMSITEFNTEKTLYYIRPSKIYPWLSNLIVSYFYENAGDFYFDDIMPVGLLAENKTIVSASKLFDKVSDYGLKIGCHGCDMSAAKYLSDFSGIHAGNGKYEKIMLPQEIVSQEGITLFLPSATTYVYKLADISFILDVLGE